jgi:hypothetical protein
MMLLFGDLLLACLLDEKIEQSADDWTEWHSFYS